MIKRITRTCWQVSLAALLPAGCLQAALDDWNALTAAQPSTDVGTTADTSGAADVDLTSGIQTVTTTPSDTTEASCFGSAGSGQAPVWYKQAEGKDARP